MSNEGFNEVRVCAGDIPNIGSGISSNSYKSAIGGEAATCRINVCGTFGHNYSRIRVLNCGDLSSTQSKVGAI